jgi:hypothetical protein
MNIRAMRSNATGERTRDQETNDGSAAAEVLRDRRRGAELRARCPASAHVPAAAVAADVKIEPCVKLCPTDATEIIISGRDPSQLSVVSDLIVKVQQGVCTAPLDFRFAVEFGLKQEYLSKTLVPAWENILIKSDFNTNELFVKRPLALGAGGSIPVYVDYKILARYSGLFSSKLTGEIPIDERPVISDGFAFNDVYQWCLTGIKCIRIGTGIGALINTLMFLKVSDAEIASWLELSHTCKSKSEDDYKSIPREWCMYIIKFFGGQFMKAGVRRSTPYARPNASIWEAARKERVVGPIVQKDQQLVKEIVRAHKLHKFYFDTFCV